MVHPVLCQLGRLASRKESTRSAFQKMRLFEKEASRIAGDSAGNLSGGLLRVISIALSRRREIGRAE